MPGGKGTYGSKKGRPPKAKMMAGGMAKKKPAAKMMGGGMAKKKKMMGYAEGGMSMKKPAANQKGLKKLPKAVRNKMGFMNKGGMAKKKAK
jgi:hypothetical protein